ncbi:MAG TPA: MBL fold metallo-hydrolase [Gammaproteobacteria bacterium]|nr:MBL fold metallo-hydrolase [Gammaproteobacteria bacterium]
MRRAVSGALAVLSMCTAVAPLAFGADAPKAVPQVTGDRFPTSQGDLVVHAMKHATIAFGWNGRTVYVDPTEGPQMRYEEKPAPDLIVLTGPGKDHVDVAELQKLVQKTTRIVAPVAVQQELPPDLQSKTAVLARGESTAAFGIGVDSAAGRGAHNGYVLTFGGTRVYVSGDLEDPAEIGGLENIAVAFVDFNEPPATTAESTAAAVRALNPKAVYPYNYKGGDPVEFRGLVGWESKIEVRIRTWY